MFIIPKINEKQVDEVQNIMKSNVEKVLERDGKLSQMEDRASRLQEGTEQVLKAIFILPLFETFV